jgi:glycosyltransferase involved in cell wall biosynthesis
LKLTVITPVFNGQKYIALTVSSILRSFEGKDFEYIVVDDGSTDETLNELEPFLPHILLIRQDNLGQSAAINCALKRASGELGLIVNADDPITNPKLYQVSVAKFEEDSEIVVTYPWWSVIDENNSVLKNIYPPIYSDQIMVGRGKCLMGPGTFFNLPVAKEIGGWNLNYKFMPDYEFWLRMTRQGKSVVITELLALWRQHIDSTSVSGRGKSMSTERIRVTTEFLLTNKLDLFTRISARIYAYLDALIFSINESLSEKIKILFTAVTKIPLIILTPRFWLVLFLYLSPNKTHTNIKKIRNGFIKFHKM